MCRDNAITKLTSAFCVTSLLSSAAGFQSAKVKLLQDKQSSFSSRNAERTNARTKHNLERSPLGLEDPVPQTDMLRLYVAHLLVATVRLLKCCRELKKIQRRRADFLHALDDMLVHKTGLR